MRKEYPKGLLTQIDRVRKGYTNKIDCYKMNLKHLPPQLFELVSLNELYLKETSLDHLPKEIGNLESLRKLDLSNNRLVKLPEQIGSLKRLNYLSLSGNELKYLPKSMKELTLLKNLLLSYNQLTELDYSLVSLKDLIEIQLHGNLFRKIPDVIYELKNLRHFYFTPNSSSYVYYRKSIFENTADEISSKICQLEHLELFDVNPNNFKFPPPEIVSRGIIDIKRFFLQIEAEGEDYLHEAKLLIVGEPGAGKTTLARKLIDINSPLPDDEETTRGIDIYKFEFETTDKINFKINIWDFGGQEIYHSTHQFFLTKRSLYLLVSDTRKEDTSYNYWLQVIELLSDSSAVILINNEKQDRSRDINWGAIRKRFYNLKDRIQKSNFATKRGLPELLDVIKYEIQRLPHVGDKLPKTWIRVRKAIEELAEQKDYISDDEFYEICDFNGIHDYERAKQLSNYFHDLGVFLHFKDGSILERTIILNNTWATNAVYKVLDDKYIKDVQKGRFVVEDLIDVWDSQEYYKKKEELLALMLKFELCYRVPNSSLFIVPELLPISEPIFAWDESSSLKTRFVYEFMPKGIITKLIVRMHKDIQNERLVWKEGVVLKRKGETALIKESYDKKEIQIFVLGNQPKILLTVIAEEINNINQSYSKINCQQYIPCNCSQCKELDKPHYYVYSDVLRRIEKGKSTIECAISFIDIKVNQLVNNVFDSEEKRKSRKRHITYPKKKIQENVFISYSHKDMIWLDHLKRHLKPVKYVDFWDDSMIVSGEKWHERIENAINQARIAILLLSADFFSSDFIINNELPPLLEAAENKGTVVLVVVLKPCLVEEFPLITRYQFINSPNDTIIQMDEASQELTWLRLVNEVKKYLNNNFG